MISKKNESGVILIGALIIVVVFTAIGITILSAASSQSTLTKQRIYSSNALLAAEAGIEQTLQQLNVNDSFAGYPTAQAFFSNSAQGQGTFTTSIASVAGNPNAKLITSTSRVTLLNNPTKQVGTRTIRVTAVGTGSSGYSVHTGPGGLILGGSANITNSEVYVNGTLTLNGASKIGTSSQPLNVFVANQACPAGNSPGPTYPQTCSSTQPISLAQSTAIYGTVCATGQTSKGPNNNIKPGSTGAGLQVGCTAPNVSPPTYDRASHIVGMTTTTTSTSNNYLCQSSPFNRTWPANLRITGNVSIGSSCNIVIRGNAYITGDLTIGGAAKITVDNSVGTTRPVVVVDGKITLGGSAQLIANSSGTGIQFISFRSSASCSPTCTTVTGTDLKTSQNLETVSVGGAANLPGMVFQAYWGKITVGGSGNLGAAIGQTVDLSGAGTVTFGTALSSGARTWTISSYQQRFSP